MATRTIETQILATVPIGNRVRIEFFKVKGFLGSSTNTTHPQITDLDSGIVYGTHWHKQESEKGALEVAHFIEGSVKACQVLTSGGDHAFHATILEIQVSSQGGPE